MTKQCPYKDAVNHYLAKFRLGDTDNFDSPKHALETLFAHYTVFGASQPHKGMLAPKDSHEIAERATNILRALKKGAVTNENMKIFAGEFVDYIDENMSMRERAALAANKKREDWRSAAQAVPLDIPPSKI